MKWYNLSSKSNEEGFGNTMPRISFPFSVEKAVPVTMAVTGTFLPCPPAKKKREIDPVKKKILISFLGVYWDSQVGSFGAGGVNLDWIWSWGRSLGLSGMATGLVLSGGLEFRSRADFWCLPRSEFENPSKK